VPWAVALGCVVAALVVAFIHFREAAPPDERRVSFQIQPPAKSEIENFRLSPDGRHLVFVVNEVGRVAPGFLHRSIVPRRLARKLQPC